MYSHRPLRTLHNARLPITEERTIQALQVFRTFGWKTGENPDTPCWKDGVFFNVCCFNNGCKPHSSMSNTCQRTPCWFLKFPVYLSPNFELCQQRVLQTSSFIYGYVVHFLLVVMNQWSYGHVFLQHCTVTSKVGSGCKSAKILWNRSICWNLVKLQLNILLLLTSSTKLSFIP